MLALILCIGEGVAFRLDGFVGFRSMRRQSLPRSLPLPVRLLLLWLLAVAMRSRPYCSDACCCCASDNTTNNNSCCSGALAELQSLLLFEWLGGLLPLPLQPLFSYPCVPASIICLRRRVVVYRRVAMLLLLLLLFMWL